MVARWEWVEGMGEKCEQFRKYKLAITNRYGDVNTPPREYKQ